MLLEQITKCFVSELLQRPHAAERELMERVPRLRIELDASNSMRLRTDPAGGGARLGISPLSSRASWQVLLPAERAWCPSLAVPSRHSLRCCQNCRSSRRKDRFALIADVRGAT